MFQGGSRIEAANGKQGRLKSSKGVQEQRQQIGNKADESLSRGFQESRQQMGNKAD